MGDVSEGPLDINGELPFNIGEEIIDLGAVFGLANGGLFADGLSGRGEGIGDEILRPGFVFVNL